MCFIEYLHSRCFAVRVKSHQHDLLIIAVYRCNMVQKLLQRDVLLTEAEAKKSPRMHPPSSRTMEINNNEAEVLWQYPIVNKY